MTALDEVDERDVQTSWRLAMAAAWLGFLAPWALALLAVAGLDADLAAATQ